MGLFSLQSEDHDDDGFCGDGDVHHNNSTLDHEAENEPPNRRPLFRSTSLPSALLERALTRFQRRRSLSLEEGEIREDIDVVPEEEDEDDDSFSEEQNQHQMTPYRPLNQVMRWQQQQQQSPSAPIHYHIYYTPSEPPPPPPSNLMWKCIALVAVLSHVVYLYGPASPPPIPSDAAAAGAEAYQHDGYHHHLSSWQSFGAKQSQMVLGMIATWASVLQYVAVWCWQGVVDDVHFWILPQEAASTTEASPPSSSTTTSLDCRATSLEQDDDFPLFGQEAAMARLQAACQSRRHKKHHSLGSTGKAGPLVIYATGGPGVGKRRLAQWLAQQQQQQCGKEEGGLLEIDLGSGEWNEDDEYLDSISKRIQSHVVEHKDAGSVLLLSHLPVNDEEQQRREQNDGQTTIVDETPPSRFHKILQLMEHLMQQQDSQRDNLWETVTIVLTSSLGSTAIDKTIRHYHGTSGIPMRELESYLRQQFLDEVLPPDSTLSTFSPLLEQAVVLPFWPLERSAVRAIVLHELSRLTGRDIQMAPHYQQQIIGGEYDPYGASSEDQGSTTLDFVLDNALEWQTWIHKPTQTELYTFLPRGGHDVVAWLVPQLLPPDKEVECWDRLRNHGDVVWLDSLSLETPTSAAVTTHLLLRLLSCPTAIDAPNHVDCLDLCQYPFAG